MRDGVDVMKMFHRTHRMGIKVRRQRELRFRFWLGARLLILGAWVVGCPAEVELVEEAQL